MSATGIQPIRVNVPIGTGTGQHLVDPNDVVWVDPYTQMERVLSGCLHNVFVCADTSRFESLGRQLLVLVRDEMATEGEVIDRRSFTAEIIDTDLRLRDTSVVSRFGEADDSAPRRGLEGADERQLTACSCSIGSNERDGDPF